MKAEENGDTIHSILILGGGTAGWMTAAVLARFLLPGSYQITLVESKNIGTIGVGEASVPLLRQFNGMLGIDDRTFIQKTSGTFKLGIEFKDWGHKGNSFFHGFGDYGDTIDTISPHHYWLKLKRAGDVTPLDAYSLPWALASRKRFAPPEMIQSESEYNYAFHFDAGLYADFLKEIATGMGVRHIEGEAVEVSQDAESGYLKAVQLEDGRTLQADFFVDCSGFRGLLIEETLQTGYEDWRRWLPCDRAVVVASEDPAPPASHTISTAQAAGWQWTIPLQHRTGNGYVFASGWISEDQAQETLLSNTPGRVCGDTRLLKFVTGRRKKFWNKNCVAIGLAGGFMEPLESTSIQLIQTAISRLIEFFPDKRFDPAVTAEFNRITTNEFKRIRDFLILHYCLTERDDTGFWQYCRTMELPETLQYKIDIFRSMGHVPLLSEESYQEPSWVSIFFGNGCFPERYDPLVDRMDINRMQAGMRARASHIARLAESASSHQYFLEAYCKDKVA